MRKPVLLFIKTMMVRVFYLGKIKLFKEKAIERCFLNISNTCKRSRSPFSLKLSLDVLKLHHNLTPTYIFFKDHFQILSLRLGFLRINYKAVSAIKLSK